jgi:hypothetical protein
MQRTFKTPSSDSKKCRPKTVGGINKEPEKDGIVKKKVCGIITKENKKHEKNAYNYFEPTLWQ